MECMLVTPCGCWSCVISPARWSPATLVNWASVTEFASSRVLVVRFTTPATWCCRTRPGSFLCVVCLLLVPPPHRALVKLSHLGRNFAALVDLPPDVHPADGALDDLGEEAAHPVGFRLAHGELVFGLNQQHPGQSLGPQLQVRLVRRVQLVQGGQ